MSGSAPRSAEITRPQKIPNSRYAVFFLFWLLTLIFAGVGGDVLPTINKSLSKTQMQMTMQPIFIFTSLLTHLLNQIQMRLLLFLLIIRNAA